MLKNSLLHVHSGLMSWTASHERLPLRMPMVVQIT